MRPLYTIAIRTGCALLLALPAVFGEPASEAVAAGQAREARGLHLAGSSPSTQGTQVARGTANANQAASTGDSRNSNDEQDSTGVVIQSNCRAGLQVQLKTSAGTLHLHGRPGAYPKILAPSGQAAGSTACKALQGQRVTARYKLDDATGENATVEMIQILGSEDNEANAGPQTPPANSENALPSGGNAILRAAPGDQTTAEGKVTEVTCNGNEMQIKIASGNGALALHARDYTRLSYDDDRSAFERKDFPACTELKGRLAEVTFVVVEHKRYDGEIQHIEIEK